jgi:adenosylcobinamide kinase/adenosylcobinamide-phosphate guanylyltransferase
MTKAPNSGHLTFVLGGARSGKSRYAETIIAAFAPPWAYVATADAGDEEMAARIAAHRSRRGSQWKTMEAPHELGEALILCQRLPVLVDCLTLWLSNLLLAEADIDKEIARFESALDAAMAPVVLVSNEVGSGIVPEHPLGRQFRDWQGVLNQRMAARADDVILMVAGLPLTIKAAVKDAP